MNTLIQLIATALRIGGALAGATAAFLISDATLIQGISYAGLEGSVSPTMVRMGAHVAMGVLGFIVASQVAALIPRGPSIPAGTRQEAAVSVPRLRRHLVEGEKPATSAMPRYLDPNPPPTKPVAVSFKELGLEHPQPGDYPAPGGEPSEGADDFPLRERQDRPDSAGSASYEWDDVSPAPERSQPSHLNNPAPEPAWEPAGEKSQFSESVPGTTDPGADPEDEAREIAPGRAALETRVPAAEIVPNLDLASSTSDGTGAGTGDKDDIFDPWPDAATMHDAPAPQASGAAIRAPGNPPVAAPIESGASEPVAAWSPPVEPVAPPAPQRIVVEPDFSSPMVAAAPSFALPASGGEADWYDGAGDEEEDADDDGAGYGSLADIGLGKSHAPRAPAGQRGEAGMPPAIYAAADTNNLVPHGKPQDFRLREALSELQRLNRG